LGRKKPNEMKCKLHVAIQQNREKKETFVKLDQTKKQKRKRQALLEKANGIKQTNPLPNPSPQLTTPLPLPLPTPTLPLPPTLKEEKRVKKKSRPQTPQGNGFRKPTDGRRLSDRSGYACKLALFEKTSPGQHCRLGPKKICREHLSALASEPARVTLSAEFRQGSSDGARSNQAEGCQSTVASGYQKCEFSGWRQGVV
jgi:hypothetical protein